LVQLTDCPLDEAAPHFDKDILDEMSATGFVEIWIAGYTIQDAFGTVQLFGVKPAKYRSLHEHEGYGTKPYG
jgi:hypothetical protein